MNLTQQPISTLQRRKTLWLYKASLEKLGPRGSSPLPEQGPNPEALITISTCVPPAKSVTNMPKARSWQHGSAAAGWALVRPERKGHRCSSSISNHEVHSGWGERWGGDRTGWGRGTMPAWGGPNSGFYCQILCPTSGRAAQHCVARACAGNITGGDSKRSIAGPGLSGGGGERKNFSFPKERGAVDPVGCSSNHFVTTATTGAKLELPISLVFSLLSSHSFPK